MNTSAIKNLGNKYRLYLTFLLLGALSSFLILFALYSINTLRKDVETVSDQIYPLTKLAIEMEGLIGQVVEKFNVAKAAASTSRLSEIDPLNKRVEELLAELAPLCRASADKKIVESAPLLQQAYQASYETGTRMVRASIDMDFAMEGDLSREFDAHNLLMLTTLREMVESSSNLHQSSMGHILHVFGRLTTTMTIAFILLSVIGITCFWLISNMSRHLANMSEESATVATSLLTSMSYINDMTNQLSIASSSSATNLDEISSTSGHMAGRARDNLDVARSAEDSTKEVLQTAAESDKAIKDVVAAMAEMIEADKQISSLVRDIEEIAFQTNLLALNAAVEAARAGEAGAGFAVVADEVRSLAGRATVAAQNVGDLIGRLDTKIHQGEKVVTALENTFPRVHESSTTVAEQMVKIISNSSEQSDNLDQVNQAIATIDSSVQSLAAMSEEGAATVHEITDQVAALNRLVDQLIIFWEGKPPVQRQEAAPLPEYS
ncbi:MAG: hypothetical protein C0613_08620 [Desulfobulbaceae bacterium]|nr:MAG: hypothetical protein C0613_08620 [Desulfobulbaceae bacterium]